MMQRFWQALVDALRADPVLKNLTGDTNDVRHIGRNQPVGDASYPFIGVFTVNDLPAVAGSYTGFKRHVVAIEFRAKGKDNEITVIKMADRMEMLLHQDGKDQHKQYWNITNDFIWNKWTNYIRGDVNEWDEATAVWKTRVVAEFFWHLKNPPAIQSTLT